MLIFFTVLQYEWRSILRAPLTLILLLLLLLATAYAGWCGNHIVREREAAVAGILHAHGQQLQEVHQRFHGDTATAEGKQLVAQAGLPQVVEFRCPPVATLPPDRMAALAVGQLEEWPAAIIVSTKYDRLAETDVPFTNPALLAAGNFDLAFILVYIFPLLLIIVTHNSYALEHEQQTFRLLALQCGNSWKVVLSRILVRFGMVWLLAMITGILCYLLLNTHAGISIQDLLLWCYVTTLYVCCWLCFCALVISLKKSAALSLLVLLAAWCLLAIIIPSVVSSIAAVKAPLPLPAALASEQRECQEDTWNMPIQPLLDSFYQAHPEYAATRQAADTAAYGNKRFVAYYDLLYRRMERISVSYQQQLLAHNRLQQQLSVFNPVTRAQQMLSAAAATNAAADAHYRQEVRQFREQWLRFMNSYLLYDRMIPESALPQLPVFKHQPVPGKSSAIINAGIPLMVMLLLAGIPAILLSSDKKTNLYK